MPCAVVGYRLYCCDVTESTRLYIGFRPGDPPCESVFKFYVSSRASLRVGSCARFAFRAHPQCHRRRRSYQFHTARPCSQVLHSPSGRTRIYCLFSIKCSQKGSITAMPPGCSLGFDSRRPATRDHEKLGLFLWISWPASLRHQLPLRTLTERCYLDSHSSR
jgi:hypothetical protein